MADVSDRTSNESNRDNEMRVSSQMITALFVVAAATGCDGYMVVDGQPESSGRSPAATGTTGAGGGGSGSASSGAGAEGTGSVDLPAPTGPGLRRLTAFEYDNALADLLGDEARPAQALAEPTGTTYGNAAVMQKPTGNLIKAAETLARQAAATAFGDPEKAAELIGCHPEGPGDEACMRQFVRRLGERALRRPLTDEEVATFVDLGMQHARDADFEAGAEVVVRAFLQHAEFLYRREVGDPVEGREGVYRLDGPEIASRMAFLIWGTVPDAELLRAAEAGELSTPSGRRQQARRMLTGSEENRRKTLRRLQRFHKLWLGYKNAQLGDLATPAIRESNKLIERVVFEEEAGWMKLFTWRETYIGETLADHYGLPAPEGEGADWVEYGDRGRAGILSHATFMNTGTKVGVTSPTMRGKHIFETLFCGHVPPPPPTVNIDNSSIAECGPDGTCVRPDAAEGIACQTDDDCPEELGCKSEYSEFYMREGSGCANCHAKMDPVGLGLENFSARGKWRTHEEPKELPGDEGLPQPNCKVDGEGRLQGVGTFSGPGELGEMVANSERAQRCAVRQFYQFAWGKRQLPGAGHPGTKGLFGMYKKADGRLLRMLVEMVADDSFALRRAPEEETPEEGNGEMEETEEASDEMVDLEPGVDIGIPALDGPPGIDGVCDEFGGADALAFETTVDGYDNRATCRVGWNGDPHSPKLHGCCEVEDGDVETVVSGDDESGIWDGDGVAWLVAGPEPEKDASLVKVEINADGDVHDANFADGEHNPGHDAAVDRKAVRTEAGYTVEWRAELPVTLAEEPVTYCNFRINDRDAGNPGWALTFGSPILSVDGWGKCQFVAP